jgi:hypothetical protein
VRDHVTAMSAEKPDAGDGAGSGKGGDVMSSLPRTRPQRPSRRRASGRPSEAKAKRAPRAAAKPAAARASGARAKPSAKGARAASVRPKPQGVRPSAATRAASRPPPSNRPPSPPTGTDIVGTAVQAAGELAQLGLTLGTRALRDAVKRIPRP